jgi:hypothetical protein
MCVCAGLGCAVVLLYLCSERVAAGVTIELITFRILFIFSLFVLLFHCYAGLLFAIKAGQAAVDLKCFVSGKVHFILLQTVDTDFCASKPNKLAKTAWILLLSGTCLVSVPTGTPIPNRRLSFLYLVTEISVYYYSRT